MKLWDLRKLKNFKTLPLDEGYEVRDLSFDSSGSYLAVAGSDVRVYLCKQWDVLKVSATMFLLHFIDARPRVKAQKITWKCVEPQDSI